MAVIVAVGVADGSVGGSVSVPSSNVTVTDDASVLVEVMDTVVLGGCGKLVSITLVTTGGYEMERAGIMELIIFGRNRRMASRAAKHSGVRFNCDGLREWLAHFYLGMYSMPNVPSQLDKLRISPAGWQTRFVEAQPHLPTSFGRAHFPTARWRDWRICRILWPMPQILRQ